MGAPGIQGDAALYWLLRSSVQKKTVKERSHRSCALQSTHQTGDDVVLVCLFPSWFLE